MLNSIDLYLGTFLIICGFTLSLFNLRRIVKNYNASFSMVLLSENLILMSIGIAFLSRSVYGMNSVNLNVYEMEARIADPINTEASDSMQCNFKSVLMSYGPFIVSLVNSFLSLIIDNYMHYRMMKITKQEDDRNTVQDISRDLRTENTRAFNISMIWKKYFSYLAIGLQWIIPVLIALLMYPMSVKEKTFAMSNIRSTSDNCMAMLDHRKCFTNHTNFTLELRTNFPQSVNYIEVYETEKHNSNVSTQLNSVIDNVYKIVENLKNQSHYTNFNVTSPLLLRKGKTAQQCTEVCYVENKSLLSYMFMLAIISFFVPITISTIILTKIHVMDVNRPNVKTDVSRELLYNILFWTPVMLDTFLSLIYCSYIMNGVRTSIFNVVANVYQAVKNFMNTKYFKDNIINPI